MYRINELEMRVLILAPTGRDAALIANTLHVKNIAAGICPSVSRLIELLQEGAGAAIIAEEAISPAADGALIAWVGAQPPWSDVPFLVLTARGQASAATVRRAKELLNWGNVTPFERPVRPETIETAVRAALRARTRQYEMRSRQENLTQANADLEQFAYSASHDLQEPIRIISIYSSLVARRYDSVLDGVGKEFLSYVISSAQRMALLVSDLLEYSKVANVQDDESELTNATGPLQASLANLSEAIRDSDAKIVYSPLPSVRMRPVHLQQLFQNLISNALKYRRAEVPQISITAISRGSHWLFAFADNGIGIEPQYKQQIFGIFKRLHRQEDLTGTGIGLAICKRVVERYHGQIWVESELGVGSTFFFTIPS